MKTTPIKILLVDDEMLIRSGLAILLESFAELAIVGQAENGQEAVDFCEMNPVDVVLMDIRMPEMNGIEATQRIKENYPAIKILILTTFQDAEYIAQAMKLGASGYLLKDSSDEEIFEAIKIVNNNNVVLDGQLAQSFYALSDPKMPSAFDAEGFELNEKEVEIIRLVASGFSNQEISEQMYLSLGTIKNNISAILSKLELRDRTQLAIFAFEQNILN